MGKLGILYLFVFFFAVTNIKAQQCDIIYVSPSGTSSAGSGTSTNPANLNYAINNLVTANSNILWLADGTYNLSMSLDIDNDLTIEGGFDPITWIKSNYNSTLILKDASNPLTSPDRIVAIQSQNKTNFRLQDINVEVIDASGTSVSTYALYLNSSSNYVLCRSSFSAGNATDGIDGVPGANGVNGTDGSQGGAGEEDKGSSPCCNEGGQGAIPSYAGSTGGGDGGDGGTEGTSGGLFGGGSAPPGSPGYSIGGPLDGSGGIGGQGNCGLVGQIGSCPAGPANAGTDGDDGNDGGDGADGAHGLINFADYFYPGNGVDGDQGEHGGAGGGGGGGGSQGCLSSIAENKNGVGPGGGGGGEGGEGGQAATGGSGGGGSFGSYIYFNGSNTFIKDCEFNAGAPGFGGKGGFPGGMGGYGGLGAAGQVACQNGDSGAGGDGGDGGQGGNGGDGQMGVSVDLYEHSVGIAASQTDMKASVEPQIWVENLGCTFSDIVYSTNANGLVEWYFDGGTYPLNGVGNSITVQYSNQARHSITLIVNGVPYMFTDFTGIFKDGTPYLPEILSPDSIICPGNTASFNSSYAGIDYLWEIHDGQTITTSNNTSTSHTFNSTGTFLVSLKTKSDCCGWSKADSFYVEVKPMLATDVLINASDFNICNGDSVLFGATPINGGDTPSFQWQLNGQNIPGATNQSYMAYSLNNGDQVSCIMTSDYPCPINQTATSQALTIYVSNTPNLTCSGSVTYLGNSTQFVAVGSGGTPNYSYSWDFGDGGSDTTATPSHTYGSTGSYNYTVTITDLNGCSNICTNNLTVLNAPLVNSGFNIDTTMICGSTTVQFTDMSSGNTTAWKWDFGDGNTSTDQNPLYTYSTPGFYTVTLIASNSAYKDTLIKPNVIQVLTPVNAQIDAINNKGCYPFEAQFLDATNNGSSWSWSFGNVGSTTNTSTLQNPSHVYENIGAYEVILNVSASNGCFGSDTMIITVEEPPEVDLGEDLSYCPQESLELQSLIGEDPSYSYEWSPDEGLSCIDCYTTSTTTKKDLIYILTVESYPMCSASDSIFIDADTALCENTIFVPSAFSPNNDGINDILYVRATNLQSMNFYIYNRFGELVFTGFNINDGWDGTQAGELLNPEVYMYVVKAIFEDGSLRTVYGNVSLVR